MARNKTNGNLKEWQHVVRVVAIVGGVLGTLALGAVLHVEPTPIPESTARMSDHDPLLTPSGAGDSAVDDAPRESSDRADERPQGSRDLPAETPSVSRDSSTARMPEPAPRSAPALSSAHALSMRVSESESLVDDGSGWTLQFMLTCDDAKAERLLRDVGQDSRLHLLPTVHQDRSCLRICWNRYASRDEAVADRDLPSALLALSQQPMPRKLADLAP